MFAFLFPAILSFPLGLDGGLGVVCFADSVIIDVHGAIIRGDLSKKQLALVFTGDEFADGGVSIRQTLASHEVPGAFFLTGKFYANKAFRQLISDLKKDGHYLGAHSDQHLLYADWTKRDSLLVTEPDFKRDLLANYERMRNYGILATDAPYFLPPYEWYNSTVARWTAELGLQLINFTPGTRSHADYTIPEMGAGYLSSDAIYRSVIDLEQKSSHGLNGFILLMHIGTDPRRTDKFYVRLGALITELKSRGYKFVRLKELLN